MDMLAALIDKFPMFDPTWDDQVAAAWFAGYDRLLTMVAGVRQPKPAPTPTPTPARTQARTTAAKRELSAAERAQAQRMVADGAQAGDLVATFGVTAQQAAMMVTRGRRRAQAAAGFRDGDGADDGR